ncbi:GNAT family N-acetyltransferase [Pseudonocardia benzenivorans]|uniref:GCN5-related N-acetyltransferase n=2 Tax=Pseudonocardia TaxID=1847 RepID=F4CR48_PSEUX|nr:GNAT family N-acetyltransferase [Pseudonocardia dioxanivorans]AEA24485.1 GCN5-related N-acetyltransferase [Pseudonocardia dioxanivorans CB1190]
MTDRSPLFCDTALAARIEAAETELIVATSRAALARTGTPGFVLPLAGGAATFAGAGSPYTKVVGLGFGGVPTEAELDELEDAYAAHDAPVQIELSHLGDPELPAVLTARGYRLEGYENVLGRALDGDHATDSDIPAPRGVEVRISPEAELDAWIAVVTEASLHQDAEGLPWHDEFPRQALEDAERDSAAAGLVRYSAYRDGVLAGGAEFRVTGGIAQFAGAATAVAHRRHGIQTALLIARLVDARAAGCDVAVIVTQPGSKSQQNAQRRGFDLLYTRATLVGRPRGHASPAASRSDRGHDVTIALHSGPREQLRPLFELAEDSATQLDAYLDDGDVLVARIGEKLAGHLQLVATGRPDEVELKNMAVDESLQGNGIGRRLVRAAVALAGTRGARRMIVATAAADIGNLRFYQRVGFRMRAVDREAFVPATGYPEEIVIDGIVLRDRVWLDLDL